MSERYTNDNQRSTDIRDKSADSRINQGSRKSEWSKVWSKKSEIKKSLTTNSASGEEKV